VTSTIPDPPPPSRAIGTRILDRLTAARPPRGPLFGACGCERPSLRHDPGCLWKLDRRKPPAAAKLTRRVDKLEPDVAQLRRDVDKLARTVDQLAQDRARDRRSK
jgi:hypothetical protein